MRALLAFFVVVFLLGAVGVWFVMLTELKVIASILLLGFAGVIAGVGGVIDVIEKSRHASRGRN